MKSYLLPLLMLIFMSVNAFAQKDETIPFLKKDDVTGDYYFEEVVTLDNTTKEAIFSRCKKWIVANIKTGDNNIQADDKEGTIDNTGAMRIEPKKFSKYSIKDGAFDYKLHVWVKDNKYKVKIDNVMIYLITMKEVGYVTNPVKRNLTYGELNDNKPENYIRKQIDDQLSAFISALKGGMKVSKQNNNDW